MTKVRAVSQRNTPSPPTHTTDVKDILGMPRAAAADDRLKQEGKAKPEKMKRPEGMSREAFALLGGSNPVIPTHLLGESERGDGEAV